MLLSSLSLIVFMLLGQNSLWWSTLTSDRICLDGNTIVIFEFSTFAAE